MTFKSKVQSAFPVNCCRSKSVPTNLHTIFFINTVTTKIYTLSLHDALPISPQHVHEVPGIAQVIIGIDVGVALAVPITVRRDGGHLANQAKDRKSTRLNSSHPSISYAVFCLKKKNKR